MDTDLVLLWMLAVWWLAGVVGAVKLARLGQPAWLAAHGVVLLGALLAHVAWPGHPGGVGVALFTILVLVPAGLQRRAMRLSGLQQLVSARRTARVAAWLHPADGYVEMVDVLDALASARAGDEARATSIFERIIRHGAPAIRNVATLQLMRMRGDWPRFAELTENAPTAQPLDASLLTGRMRALGEVGRLDEMVALYSRSAPSLRGPAWASARHFCQLFVLAFCGRTEALSQLLAVAIDVDADTREHWHATALYAAGRVEEARQRLGALSASNETLVARAARERLRRPPVASSTLSPTSNALLDRIVVEVAQDAHYGGRLERTWRPFVTYAILALNLLAFGVEVRMGGSQNAETLYRAGALYRDPGSPLQITEAWRIVTALFLHLGPLHLALNMLGLWVLAPFVERRLGRWRMLIVYLASGLAGSTWMAVVPAQRPALFLGASGCIMGMLGATAAILLEGKRHARSEVASQRLKRIAPVLLLQVAFDLSVPGISMIAHYSGVALGFALGYAFALRQT